MLFLYSYGYGGKGVEVFNDSFRDELANSGFSITHTFFEFLDLERHQSDPKYRKRLLDFLKSKYAQRRIDLILTGQQPALNFLLDEGRVLAPEAAAITVLAPMPTDMEAASRRIVSHSAAFDIQGTLQRALEMFPKTQRIVFASGSSEADRKLAANAQASALPWSGKLAFEFTYDLSLQDMLKRVAGLPPDTVILFTQYNRDALGQVTVAYEVERMIVKAANAPVFGLYDFNLLNGGMGGSVLGVRKLGQRTAQLALDVLSGQFQLPRQVTSVKSESIPMFDWGQIKRWGGDPGRLGPDSVFVNRVPTLWQQYRNYIVALTAFFLAQSLLIAALIVSRRQRRLGELKIEASEQNLAITQDSIGDAVIATDPTGRVTRMNPAAQHLSGWTPADALGRSMADVFRIMDGKTGETMTDPVQQAMAQGKALGLSRHAVLLARDGQKYRIAYSAAPIRNAADEVVGVVLVFSDVTEQYRVEEALHLTRFSVEAASDAIFWITSDARIVEANAAACRSLGRSREELLQ
ncbi:MAG: PAS domain-containing protein, partial [Rhodoferax sp.]